jgi:hypothetical protein
VGLVLVHSVPLRTRANALSFLPDEAAVTDEAWWNIWKTRKQPFSIITDDVPILLLYTWLEEGRTQGLLTWLVEARGVHTGQFADKAQAVTAISQWIGVPIGDVRNHPYAIAAADEAGTVICWYGDPVRRLDTPRPSGLVLDRNGWLVTDDAHLHALGVDLGGATTSQPSDGRRGGQGRRIDAAAKLAIEKHAEVLVERWCLDHHWTDIVRTGATQSWDFEGTDSDAVHRFIEVKGTTGGPSQVEVTAGEVRAAWRHGGAHLIAIVHNIDLAMDANGVPVASGGTMVVHNPWSPRRVELAETRYTWTPAADRIAAE